MGINLLATRKGRTATFITLVIILLVVAIAVRIINNNRPTAQEDTLSSSQLIVHIDEAGFPAEGIINFGGDCPDQNTATQDGGVFCTMDSTSKLSNGVDYEIDGIVFQSFTSKTSFALPLRPATGESEPITIPAGKTVSLLAMVRSDGTITMKVMKNGSLVNLPSGVGLFPPE